MSYGHEQTIWRLEERLLYRYSKTNTIIIDFCLDLN